MAYNRHRVKTIREIAKKTSWQKKGCAKVRNRLYIESRYGETAP